MFLSCHFHVPLLPNHLYPPAAAATPLQAFCFSCVPWKSQTQPLSVGFKADDHLLGSKPVTCFWTCLTTLCHQRKLSEVNLCPSLSQVLVMDTEVCHLLGRAGHCGFSFLRDNLNCSRVEAQSCWNWSGLEDKTGFQEQARKCFVLMQQSFVYIPHLGRDEVPS